MWEAFAVRDVTYRDVFTQTDPEFGTCTVGKFGSCPPWRSWKRGRQPPIGPRKLANAPIDMDPHTPQKA